MTARSHACKKYTNTMFSIHMQGKRANNNVKHVQTVTVTISTLLQVWMTQATKHNVRWHVYCVLLLITLISGTIVYGAIDRDVTWRRLAISICVIFVIVKYQQLICFKKNN